MENAEFYKRIDDLCERADRRGILTKTGFLTLSEQNILKQYYRGERMIMTGGQQDCERKIAFFLPDYMDSGMIDFSEHINAVKVDAHFGKPGHRDYMGAVLGLGISREALGDIRILDETAYIFCIASVQPILVQELKKVGRIGVTTELCKLEDVSQPIVKVKTRMFTVKSLRLDAVTGQMFGISRSAVVDMIQIGLVKLNDSVCDKAAEAVKEGDSISLRGHGKGHIKAVGGKTKKDRLYVETEVLI